MSGNFEHSHGEEIVDRLAKIEYANPNCADCPAHSPRWVSFLLDKRERQKDTSTSSHSNGTSVRVEGYLCVLLCDTCAIHHHRELGEKRCKIRCLECVHEWTHEELDIVSNCGNDFVNEYYEAKDPDEACRGKDVVAEDRDEECEWRAFFIKSKYKKCRYRDDEALQEALVTMDRLKEACARSRKTGGRSSWSTSVRSTEKSKSHYGTKQKRRFSCAASLVSRKMFSSQPRYSSSASRVTRVRGSMSAFSASLPDSGVDDVSDIIGAGGDLAPSVPTRCLSEAGDHAPSMPSRCISETASNFSSSRTSEGSSKDSTEPVVPMVGAGPTVMGSAPEHANAA
ncbi:expressed unknown protein [Seminavis robusta]|uniref:Arf-GAP domain-containing protein n=1 Tax=Seminavis robusta TaxID=568900 RepID=A0A9N8DUK3_9STRA|nr:expressed unknown protein [Seminavis robusta]|eukprot:Sro292_g109700.1 n/a (340) ;mRNA; f:64206-65225